MTEFTVQDLINELNKIEDKELYVLDSANDFIEEVLVTNIGTQRFVCLL